MNTHKRYLIIVENLTTGYVIGFSNNFKQAEKAFNELMSKQIFQLNYDGLVLFENDEKYTTFSIHKTARHFQPMAKLSCSNGAFSIYILDTRYIEDFSLRKFLFERTKTVYAFDLAEYDMKETAYVKRTLEFIAN